MLVVQEGTTTEMFLILNHSNWHAKSRYLETFIRLKENLYEGRNI